MKKILLKFNYENGIGDTLISIFDVLNCIDFIKTKYPQVYTIFLINDLRITHELESILNLDFFAGFSDEFIIGNYYSSFINGYCDYDGQIFKRIYSGRNDNLLNNVTGIFDAYMIAEDYEKKKELEIPFHMFTFNETDDRIKNFPIFNDLILEESQNFIHNNLGGSFESICYRSMFNVDEKCFINFRNQIEFLIPIGQRLFLCSDSREFKTFMMNTNFDLKMYRKINNHPNFLNGRPTGKTANSDMISAAVELNILAESSRILYHGESQWISYFTWYARNIKRVPLIDIK